MENSEAVEYPLIAPISEIRFWRTKQNLILHPLYSDITSFEQHTINLKTTFTLHVHIDFKMHPNRRDI